jgi:hypothetical protein
MTFEGTVELDSDDIAGMPYSAIERKAAEVLRSQLAVPDGTVRWVMSSSIHAWPEPDEG